MSAYLSLPSRGFLYFCCAARYTSNTPCKFE